MSDVLLVEDELVLAVVVEDVLRRTGLEVQTSHSAEEAFARLEAEPGGFAVVVTDVNLGGERTGFDVAARARVLNRHVQIVYVTGRPSNIHSAEHDALMFPKPFDPIELAAQVNMLLGRRG